MFLALDCPTKMLKPVSMLSDFETVSALRYQEDADYKKYHVSSSMDKILNCDCNLSPEDTLAMAKDAGCHLIITSNPHSFQDPSNIMGILDGDSFLEVAGNIGVLLGNKIASLAVPFSICSRRGDTPEVMVLRRALVISLVPPEVPVHLLGYLSLLEFWWYKNRANMSINTSVPVTAGLSDIDILAPLTEKVPAHDLLKKVVADKAKWGQVCRNVAILRKYL